MDEMSNHRYRKTIPIRMDPDRLKQFDDEKLQVPMLTIISGKNAGTRLKITEDSKEGFYIGRDEKCALCIPDKSVSRFHSRVWIEQQDQSAEPQVMIQDLNSTNKTLVNGIEVEKTVLRSGSKVIIGDAILLFECLDPVAVKFYEDLMNKAESAEVDPLTELLSKRFFLETLPGVYDEVVKNGNKFSLIIVDIDYFKSINDGYGHEVGDQVLQIIAAAIKASIRKEDLGIRYGGDEIIIALPNTSIDNAYEVAERLRKTVEEHDCSSFASGMKLSISVGVSSVDGEKEFIELMRLADQALYKAKEAGRNQVITLV